MYVVDYFFSVHLPQMGLFVNPSLKRYPSRWQCPASTPTTHHNFNSPFVLLADGPCKSPVICLSPLDTRGLKPIYTEVRYWALLFMPLVISHHLLNVFVQLAKKNGIQTNNKQQNPWSESASELYRPSDRRLSAKLLPTFADRGCHVVSVTDPYGRILDFLDRSRYFSIK
jgi:hypothetical protein